MSADEDMRDADSDPVVASGEETDDDDIINAEGEETGEDDQVEDDAESVDTQDEEPADQEVSRCYLLLCIPLLWCCDGFLP
jgi:hypothetical protein